MIEIVVTITETAEEVFVQIRAHAPECTTQEAMTADGVTEAILGWVTGPVRHGKVITKMGAH